MSTIQPGTIVNEDDLFSNINDTHINSWLQSIDAILLLGGGVPLSPTEPPLYVQRRCDVVATIMNKHTMPQLPAVICLSAGTAHLPQYILPHTGLPLWESTASAAYLMQHAQYPVPKEQVFAETTSFDTISNAFYTRTTFTDVTGWRRILVVSNEFHIGRSKAIFDWIFSVPASTDNNNIDNVDNNAVSTPYEMYYLSCNNVGLTEDAIQSRKAHEARGEVNVRTKLANQYTTLQSVWEFLTTKHDFYAADLLVQKATGTGVTIGADNLLKASYGKSLTGGGGNSRMVQYNDGRVVLSLSPSVVVGLLAAVVILCLSSRNQGRRVLNPFH